MITDEMLHEIANQKWAVSPYSPAPAAAVESILAHKLISSRQRIAELGEQLRLANEDANSGWLYADHMPSCCFGEALIGGAVEQTCICGKAERLRFHRERVAKKG